MNQVVKNKDREESRAKVKPHDEGGEELGSGDMNQVVKKMTMIKDTKILDLQAQLSSKVVGGVWEEEYLKKQSQEHKVVENRALKN